MTQPSLDLGYALEILPGLLKAALVTLEITALGSLIAIIGGLVIATVRVALPRWGAAVLAAAVELVRSTPILIQLFLVFYVLPKAGILLSPLVSGLVVIGVQYSAYLSEVFRSGIASVPRGQWEASLALGYGPVQQWSRVILPQAVPRVLPIVGSYVIALIKDTPVLALVGVQELLGTALTDASHSFRYVEPIALVGLIFMAMSIPSSVAVNKIQRRLEIQDG